MDWVTTCTRCGTALEYPADPRDVDQEGGLWRSYCDACNAAFEASMRAQFPHGQCRRCGAAYAPCADRCACCEGHGEVVVLDGSGYQWGQCGRCLGSGETTFLAAPHEETLCGFPDGEGVWWEMPTAAEMVERARADVVLTARIRARTVADQAAVDGWLRSQEVAGPLGEAVDDLPF